MYIRTKKDKAREEAEKKREEEHKKKGKTYINEMDEIFSRLFEGDLMPDYPGEDLTLENNLLRDLEYVDAE